MLRRPLATLAAVLSAAAALVVPLAGSAHAEGTCTLTPPARIALYADETTFPAALSGECLPNGYALWFTEQFTHFGTASFGANEGYPSPLIEVPDDLDFYGRTQWYALIAGSDDNCTESGEARFAEQRASALADGARRTGLAARSAEGCNDLTQNEPYSDIRLGAYGAISGTRNSASRVTFTVTSAVWSPAADKLVNRSMKGELQTQYADGSWHKVGNSVATGSNGKATFAVSLPQRTWRFAVYSTPRSFDRASTPITR